MDALKGKVAIVTGASSGIGAATAQALAQGGAHPVLAARRLDRLHEIEQRVDLECLSVETDVSRRDEVQNLFARAMERFERVDIVINNAGVLYPGQLDQLRVPEWDTMIDINLKGALYVIAEALLIMKQQASGHIVNVGSRSGHRVKPGTAVYSGTKFALRAITEGLRQELVGTGVRVSLISPGIVDTEFTEHGSDSGFRKTVAQRTLTPLRSEDVAEAVLYVLGQPDHVTAHEVTVLPTEQVN